MGMRYRESSGNMKKYVETWLSGLKYLTANEAGSKFPRGFESHRLRFESPRNGDEKVPCGTFVWDSKPIPLFVKHSDAEEIGTGC